MGCSYNLQLWTSGFFSLLCIFFFFFFLSVRAFLGENCLPSTPSLNSTPSLSGVDPVPASRDGLMSQVQLMRAMPFLLPQWMDEKQIWNKCGIQARPRRIVPGDFLFPQQEWGLLASEDAKLIQYNKYCCCHLAARRKDFKWKWS